MGKYKVIYLDGENGRIKKFCPICKESRRNVIEPVAVFIPENVNLNDLSENEINKFGTCIFHCEKENKIWIENFEKYKEWKKQREEALKEGKSFDKYFKIKWNEDLVKEFWRRVRAYRFAVDYVDLWIEAGKDWNNFKKLLINQENSPENDEIEKDKEIIEFNFNSFNKKNKNIYFFGDIKFPSFESISLEYSESIKISETGNFWYKKEKVIFKNTADFREVIFKNTAIFVGATFESKADFGEATFKNKTIFRGATFENTADFVETTFESTVIFAIRGENKIFNFSSINLNEKSYIEIRGLKTTKLILNNITNHTKNFMFFDLKLISKNKEASNKKDEKESNLEIKNSILNNMKFINCDFSEAEGIEIENSSLTRVEFINVDWGRLQKKGYILTLKNQKKQEMFTDR